jgi:uncharacterized Fe-S radical SAM superfamily protein PflX
MSASKVISKLIANIARHDIPLSIMSDNASQYTSTKLKKIHRGVRNQTSDSIVEKTV